MQYVKHLLSLRFASQFYRNWSGKWINTIKELLGVKFGFMSLPLFDAAQLHEAEK